jgi:Co/Zn/Cd efflux system component
MDACCEDKSAECAALLAGQGRVLRIVLAINAAMFAVELVSGLLAGSTALLGDSLDMLGDSLVYAFSLYVLHKNVVWRTRAALAKGVLMAAFGVGVMVEVSLKLQTAAMPVAPAMAGVGALALVANTWCFVLLWRHRRDDLNMRSTWLCSRNDLIANGAVLLAAFLVARLGSRWPDILVGLGITALFLRTAAIVLHESIAELRRRAEVT